jgi:hypothetical protein
VGGAASFRLKEAAHQFHNFALARWCDAHARFRLVPVSALLLVERDGEKGLRAVRVRLGLLKVERDCPVELVDRELPLLHDVVDEAPVEERGGVVRVQVDGRVEQLPGTRRSRLVEQHEREVVEHLEGRGANGEGGLEQGFLGPPLEAPVHGLEHEGGGEQQEEANEAGGDGGHGRGRFPAVLLVLLPAR